MLVFLLMNVLQIDAQTGNWVWGRQGTGDNIQEGYSCTTDKEGNVYATGIFGGLTATFGSYTFTNIGQLDIVLIKYDKNGNVLWAKQFGGIKDDIGNSITSDIYGNIYIIGWFDSPTIMFGSFLLTNTLGGSGDMFLIKCDANGNVLWARSAGGNLDDYGQSVTTDMQGNVYITGGFESSTILFGSQTLSNPNTGTPPFNSSDVFIVKYDTNGNVIWANSAGGASIDKGVSLISDSSGNVYLTGNFDSPSIVFGSTTLNNYDTTGLMSYDIFIVKYNISGAVLWAKVAGGGSDDEVNSIAIDNSENIYLTGYFKSSKMNFNSNTLINNDLTHAGFEDVFIVKYDSMGLALWQKKIGGSGNEIGYSIATDASGIYVSGGFYSNVMFIDSDTIHFPINGYDPMFFVKYDFPGNVICTDVLASGGDDNSGITTDGIGNVYIVSDFYNVNALIIATDTLTLTGTENFFIAKYRCPTTLGISEINNLKSEILIYPNPATTSFTIESTNKIQSIKVFDVMGSEILKQVQNDQRVTSDVSGIAKGIYFVQITVDSAGSVNENSVVNKKIVVQ